MVETQGNSPLPTHATGEPKMERTLDFNDVISYDFIMDGPDVVLQLFQPEITTKITIAVNKLKQATAKTHNELPSIKIIPKARTRPAKMTADAVRQIRSEWEETVSKCGTKNAAAAELGKLYGCSAKNIYAIVYKYSWAHIA